ncbi:unnamed protein product [Timema podura]|uniref:Uncharacterized protein n=1 Tax=Timema podura TaxID=61482 RepID=A0ABN7PAQ5_TIMPD|nr:unnamed protein product [Timema podura]
MNFIHYLLDYLVPPYLYDFYYHTLFCLRNFICNTCFTIKKSRSEIKLHKTNKKGKVHLGKIEKNLTVTEDILI